MSERSVGLPTGRSLHRYVGTVIASDVVLDGVDAADSHETVDITIRLQQPRALSAEDVANDPNTLYDTTVHADGTMVARMGPLGWIEVSADGAVIDIIPSDFEGIGTSLIRHVIIDHALPRRFALVGRTALHATAVSVDGGAVGLIGPSGRGKSTLSGAMVASGGSWVADDFLLLDLDGEVASATPTIVATRLRPDSAGALGLDHGSGEEIASRAEKRRWNVGSGRSAPVPLRCLMSLDRRDDSDGPVTVRSLTGGEAMTLLAGQWFLAGTTALSPMTFLLRTAQLLAAAPLFELSYPNSFDRLPEVVDMVRSVIDRCTPLLTHDGTTRG